MARCSGEKARGTPRAWSVLQARQALVEKTPPPGGDRVAVAAEFVGDLAITGSVVLRGAQEESAAESQGLRSGQGVAEALQGQTISVGKVQKRRVGDRHGQRPCVGKMRLLQSDHQDARSVDHRPAKSGYWRRIYDLVI